MLSDRECLETTRTGHWRYECADGDARMLSGPMSENKLLICNQLRRQPRLAKAV